MSIIIDVNVTPSILIQNDHQDYYHLHNCIFNNRSNIIIKIVYGGRLTDEYSTSIKRIILALDRAGKAIQIDDTSVNNEIDSIIKMDICRSDDEHIIALARIGNVRLLSTNDGDLRQDFKNINLINNPRGKIYSSPKHKRLLIDYGA